MNVQELTTMATRLTQAFAAQELTVLGREHAFAQRLRTITPHRLALALVAAFASQNLETLADLQRGFNALHGCCVAYKPFYKQLAKPSFPLWMQGVVAHLLQHLVLQVLEPLPTSCLARFTDLLIQDSTGLAVHDALRELFPGRFPVKAPAVVELQTTMSVPRDQAVQLSLTEQRADPRAALPPPLTLRDRLLLADRGYQGAEYGRQVDAAGGFFVLRFTRKVNPRIRACWIGGERQPEWEGQHLSAVLPALTGTGADLDVEWPRGRKRPQKVRLRLVLSWHPQKQQHLYLVTNLDRAAFPPAAVEQLYRLRWQIELLFKEWKSYSNLHRFGTANAAITQGLIWAALAAALVKRFLAHASQRVSGRGTISTRRAAMALAQHLPQLWRSLLRPTMRPLRAILRELFSFLQHQAQRSNPQREAQHGRASLGLQAAYG